MQGKEEGRRECLRGMVCKEEGWRGPLRLRDLGPRRARIFVTF
jgi:hypothetical protein